MADEKPTESRKQRLARELKAETTKTFATLLTSAFGLIAAFAWNDFVRGTINRYIAPGQGLKSQLLYAILVTLLAIVVSFQLGKLAARYKADDESK
ncbi:MAG: DUF5654 family protein [Candidatus Berkelbacteria bacterium]|nr:DUF5654 family protein [Candidatus Berkelbacteria bacterium]